MAWYLWMIAGAAAAALAFIVFLSVLYILDDRGGKRRRAVTQLRDSAERDMQQIVQDTITEMFNATRGHR